MWLYSLHLLKVMSLVAALTYLLVHWYGTQCSSMVNMAVLFVNNQVRQSILEEVHVGTFLCFRLMRKIQMVPTVRLPQSNNTQ